MKKQYESPSVEVVEFQYSDQIVAASGCGVTSGRIGVGDCTSGWEQTGHTN